MLRPLPVLVFATSVAYLPGMASPATAPRWALLSIGIPLLLWQRGSIGAQWTRAHSMGLGLLLWAALSLLWTPSPLGWAEAMWWLGLLAGAFALGAQEEDMGPTWVALAAGTAVSMALALGQTFGHSLVEEVAPPGGLFLNRNILGETCALALIGALTLSKHRWLALAPLLGLGLTYSRGALLGVAAAALVWIWGKSKPLTLGLGLALALLLLKLQLGLSMIERFAIWTDTANGITLLGHGLGSFYDEFPSWAFYQNITLSRPAHAHNEFLELLFEIGPGLGLCLGLLFWCSRGPVSTCHYLLAASAAMACFSFPWHMPVTGLVSALALGHLAAARARSESTQPQRRTHLLGRLATQLDL